MGKITAKKVFNYGVAKTKHVSSKIGIFIVRMPLAFRERIGYGLRKKGILHTYDYLKKFKNVHSGKRAFFVGTGPSLNIEDVEKLKGEIVFGVNSLIDSVNDISFPLTYYCLADKRAVRLFYEKASKSNVGNIFVGAGRLPKRKVRSHNTMIFPDTHYYYWAKEFFKQSYPLQVTDDITQIVYDGGTVIYVAMQLAAYMGIKKMYLLGVDCNYAKGVKNFNEFRPENEILNGGNEQSQFGAFIRFKKYADEHGIKVYNATRGGMLDIFPRANLDEIV